MAVIDRILFLLTVHITNNKIIVLVLLFIIRTTLPIAILKQKYDILTDDKLIKNISLSNSNKTKLTLPDG